MYVYIYVCIYICMYINVYVYMYIHKYKDTLYIYYKYIHIIFIYICIYVGKFTKKCHSQTIRQSHSRNEGRQG